MKHAFPLMPYEPLGIEDLSSNEGMFAFHVRLILEQMREDGDGDIAGDIDQLIGCILSCPKTYDIKNSDGKLDVKKFSKAYDEHRQNEANLVALCDTIYEKYANDYNKLKKLSAVYAKITNMLALSKQIASDNSQKFARDELDRQTQQLGHFEDEADFPAFADRLFWPFKKRIVNTLTREVRTHVFDRLGSFIDILQKKMAFVPVLSAHPTNVIRLAYIQKQQEVSSASQELCQTIIANGEINLTRMKEAVKGLLHEPIVSEELDENGLPKPKTPFEEVSEELYFFESIFENMSGVRKSLDATLERRAKFRKDPVDYYPPEERLRMTLPIYPKSWVIGDKDGNPIPSEPLLFSVAYRRLRLFKLYRKELKSLQQEGLTLTGSNGQPWAESFEAAIDRLEALKTFFDSRIGGADLPLSKFELDRDNLVLAKIADNFGASNFSEACKHFLSNLEGAFLDNPNHRDKLIKIIDNVRSFGFHFGVLELREKADVYSDILDYLLPKNLPEDFPEEFKKFTGYTPEKQVSKKDKESRNERNFQLMDWLQTNKPDYLAERMRIFLKDIEDTDQLRNLNKIEAKVYHTIKRLSIAAQHPDAISGMVLAEFENATNTLEALALQQAVSKLTGIHLDMPVTILLEEFDTLEEAKFSVSKAWSSKAYRLHLLRQAGGDPAKIRIPIQVAHSDNNRRSGAGAARAGIMDIHSEIPQYLKEHYRDFELLLEQDRKECPELFSTQNPLDIQVEWFEGLSPTDSSRGGGRSQTAMINAYGLFHYVKETFQNFCTIQMLVNPLAFRRLVLRVITHCAKEIAKMEVGGRDSSFLKFRHIEEAVIGAFKRCYDDYRPHFVNNIGHLFAHPLFDATRASILMNRGSRAAYRAVPSATAKPLKKVDTIGMRAIPFGNLLRDAGLHIATKGIGKALHYLNNAFPAHSRSNSKPRIDLAAEARFLGYTDPVHDKDAGQLTVTGLQTQYRVSPVFRDEVDFIGNGLIHEYPETLQKRLLACKQPGLDIETPQNLATYVQEIIPEEYVRSSELVLGAFGHELPDDPHFVQGGEFKNNLAFKLRSGGKFLGDDCSRLNFMLRNTAFEHSQDESGLHRFLAMPAQLLSDRVIMEAWRTGRKRILETQPAEWHILGNLASATLALRHGPNMTTMDPPQAMYIKRLREKMAAKQALAA
jgi:hypothetical protein